MNTLLLSTDWDLSIDGAGNIAVAKGQYAIAQDVASAVRTFLGECWYDVSQGVPYFENILGYRPSLQFMKSRFIAAGMTVPGVASIVCFLTGPGTARMVGGQLQITDDGDNLLLVETTQLQGVAPWYINAAFGMTEGSNSMDFSQSDNSGYIPGMGP